MVEPRKPPTGPITPELVLVDPDLAASAREALPENPWPAPVRIEPASPARRRGVPVAVAFSVLSFAALLAVLGVSVLPARDQPTFAADGQPIPPAAPSPSTKASEPAEPSGQKTQTTDARNAKRPAAKPTAGGRRERPRGARSAKNPAAQTTAGGRRKLPRFKPAREFAWVRQAGAVYYQIAFFRNGRPFYRTRARQPRLALPRRIRFIAGEYRWTVRAAIRVENGVRLADLIVDSTFRVGRE